MSRSIWLTRAGVAVLAPLGLALAAAPAQAAAGGIVRVTTNASGAHVVYNAAAGKVNSVTITRSGAKLVIDDRVAIRAGAGCKAVKRDRTKVVCSSKRGWAGVSLALGAGDDTVVNRTNVKLAADGGIGNDRLTGGTSADSLAGGPGVDYVNGAGGNDTLAGGPGNDRLYGGPGNDVVRAGDGADGVYGGSGNDTLVGEDGGDYVDGGAGNDRVTGDGHKYDTGFGFVDTLRGGSGFDTIVYDELAETVRIDLFGSARGTGSNGGDSVDGSFEGAWAGAWGSATFIGNNAGNVLISSNGAAVMDGRGGDDTLIAGDGDTKLSGGPGNDTLVVKRAGTAPQGGPNALDGGDGTDKCTPAFTDRDTLSGCER
ncbi:hypothetical protein GCM10010168_43510 [Actinoplanes ianthinogenes]|uniref:Hemolysin type calcium-binding protein n=1 Tax=Actinoplanes ianthinogenes TaxID=122358 RepID=A0ABM7LVV4_9ACTN|nr:calcium-binding protein [Actinoplanes ianthinogenes]BCJ43340.1 hypothetical protein Aiant_39970 [Actinoplanes ianthinogenes]GGR20782.1 hypothetical protein GCM10010168_43510 [Actinoplanes ianthinogenes]